MPTDQQLEAVYRIKVSNYSRDPLRININPFYKVDIEDAYKIIRESFVDKFLGVPAVCPFLPDNGDFTYKVAAYKQVDCLVNSAPCSISNLKKLYTFLRVRKLLFKCNNSNFYLSCIRILEEKINVYDHLVRDGYHDCVSHASVLGDFMFDSNTSVYIDIPSAVSSARALEDSREDMVPAEWTVTLYVDFNEAIRMNESFKQFES